MKEVVFTILMLGVPATVVHGHRVMGNHGALVGALADMVQEKNLDKSGTTGAEKKTAIRKPLF